VRPRPSVNGFTAESTRRALEDACAGLGLGCADATLIRLGENAIYALEDAGVVIRIARGQHHLADVEKELRVARWLAGADVPATRPTAGLPQPFEQDGLLMTFWDLIPESPAPPSMEDLARLLRTFHSLEPGLDLDLPVLQPLDRVEGRIRQTNAISDADRAFLLRRRDELADAFDQLEFVLPPGPIHGDAHRKNLLRDVDGVTHLLDFEMVAWGPREWDLSLTGGYRHGFGWITANEYEAFAATYGYDVTQWPGFPVLQAIRELTMTTWLMQNVQESPQLLQEFHLRLRDLATDARPRRWTAF
jgi:Ser/Thr protein kinase RdoA (MazF antagonist)